MRIASELVRIAKMLLAGSVSIDPMFVHEAKKLVAEQVDVLQEKADRNKETRRHGINVAKFEQDAHKAISQAREDLRHELTKEFQDVIKRVKAAIEDPELTGDLEDWLWERQRELRRTDDYNIQEPAKNRNTYQYQLVLREIDKVLDAYSKSGIDDDTVKETKKFYDERLDAILELVEKFKNHLAPLAREIEFSLEVSAHIDADMLIAEHVRTPTMYIKIANTMLNITVFPEGSKYIVDDVIDDPDFFHNSETQVAYDGLIHYLRKGQLPKDKPVKFVRLYRAMSSIEYRKWAGGMTIPKNKYFTNKATADFAYDDPDLEKKIKEDPEFSYGLEQFSVRSDCVVERDSGIFITVQECRLESGKIVPA